jgi:hypothetical protein
MPLLDPTWLPVPLQDNSELLLFKDAKRVSALLPGGLYYLHFDEPRLPSHTLTFRHKLPTYVSRRGSHQTKQLLKFLQRGAI